jgi:hypothetical protein
MTNSNLPPDANANFVFPEGSEFWVGVDSDGNTRPYALVIGPKGGWKSAAPDGTSLPGGWRFGRERVSREDWDKYVAEFSRPPM